MDLRKVVLKLASAALSLCTFWAGAAFAADNIRGQVMSGGAPIAESWGQALTGIESSRSQAGRCFGK
jgi:hypothetical protein